MNKLKSPAIVVSIIIALVITTLCGIILYYSFWPFATITDKSPSAVVNKEVKAGGVVIVVKDYCKYTKVSATLVRTLIDGTAIQLPTATSTLPEGCHVFNVSIPIPEYVPTGTYVLKTTSEYKVNPLRTISIDSLTEEFNVTGKEEYDRL